MTDTALMPYQAIHVYTLDEKIAIWLHSNATKSGSERTEGLYQDHITKFRDVLHKSGLDLDSEDEVTIASLAQGWAAYSAKGIEIAPATYDLRLSIVSSFYVFSKRRRWLKSNPIEIVDRRKVYHRHAAMPLDAETVAIALEAIDTKILMGKRDYALLSILFATGRRASEVASLTTSDISPSGESLMITWQRCKGGKVMHDILDPGVAHVLIDYLHAVYGDPIPAKQPMWASCSRQNRGKAISTQAISNVCMKHLGVSKVHTTRHSFSIFLEDAGAKLSDIGARLGHSNLAVTSKYMERLHSSENKFAGAIAQRLRIRRREA